MRLKPRRRRQRASRRTSVGRYSWGRMGKSWWVLPWALVVVLGACSAPSPRSAGGDAADGPAEPSQRNATLAMIIRDEPGTLTPKLRVGTTLTDAKRLFNAGLTIPDEL